MYLVHRRHWSFLEEFVLHGGLSALADQVTISNLYYRGQIMEIFLSATDADTYNWFEPKGDALSKTLHARMLELHDHPYFLTNLLANRKDSYPGGSFRCLQLLAFFLSWLRLLYTKEKKLLLSAAFLGQIAAWASGDFGEEGMWGKPKEEEDGSARAEEQKLAKTLHDDFGGAGTVEEHQVGKGMVGGLNMPDNSDIAPASEYRPRVEEVVEEGDDQAEQGADKKEAGPLFLKNKGSELYRSGAYSEALDVYTSALDLLLENRNDMVGDVPADDYDLEVSLHFNRATVFWKLAEEERLQAALGKKNDPNDNRGTDESPGEHFLMKAQLACQAIFLLTGSGHGVRFALKAAYRMASIQLLMHCAQQALETVDTYMSDKDGSSDMDMLRQLRRKCLASLLANGDGGDKGTDTSKFMDSRTKAMVEQLCKRKGREMRRQAHPWDGWTPTETETDVTSSPALDTAAEVPSPSAAVDSSVVVQDAKKEEDIGELLTRLNTMTGKSKSSKAAKASKEDVRSANLQKYDDLANITGIPSKGQGDKKKTKKKAAVSEKNSKEAIFRSLQLF
jgi:hypothetical protein